MRQIIALSVLVVAALAAYSEYADTRVLYHRSGVPPTSDWKILRRADSYDMVEFTLALKQENLDKLDAIFWDISNPFSANYGKYLTRAEVKDLVSASPKVQKRIINWLHKVAIETGNKHLVHIDNKGDAITVKASVSFTETLFATRLYLFHNTRKDWVMIKHLGDLNVPSIILEDIEMITGITELPPGKVPFLWDRDVEKSGKAKKQNSDNACNVPYTIKNQYGVPQNLFVTNPSANISIYAEVSFDTPEGFGMGSVKDWEVANNLPSNPIKCILGNGAADFIVNDTDVEAQLDTQMITGMAAGAQTCFYIMQQGASWMYEFANLIFTTPDAPLVVSMSYGWVEFEQCINETDGTWFLGNCTYLHIPDSKTYVARTNVEFQKLGTLGHTLLAASGDDGVCGTHGSPNGCTAQGPIFPAASPFVLTVGATSIEASTSKATRTAQPPICTNQNYGCECTTSTNEQVSSQDNTAGFDSGGGFSVYSAAPTFQAQAVNAYLKSGVTLPSRSYGWNPANRGFPDIAAIG